MKLDLFNSVVCAVLLLYLWLLYSCFVLVYCCLFVCFGYCVCSLFCVV